MQTDQSDPLRRALTQRNQAIACAILSLVISLALIMNTFLGHRRDLKAAHEQIIDLQHTLGVTQQALSDERQELRQTQEALRHEQEALARAQSH
jgi:predicted  nucleic acid-binding Zn-ribbon protein